MTVMNCCNEESKFSCKIKIKCQFKTLFLPCHVEQRQKLNIEGYNSYGNEASDLHVTLHQSSCFFVNGITHTVLKHEEE